MPFIIDLLDRVNVSPFEREERFAEYYAYLERIKGTLPISAYRFAVADWHYDFGDSRCPHDSWLQKLSMVVTASGSRSEVRKLDILVKLFGAKHDGYINLHYKDVRDYSLVGAFDWYYDEIRLAEEDSLGRLIHEIRGQAATHWTILCDDILYKWEPSQI